MKSIALAGKIAVPGQTIRVPVGTWDSVAQGWEDCGVVTRLNPTARGEYLVRCNLPAGKTAAISPVSEREPRNKRSKK